MNSFQDNIKNLEKLLASGRSATAFLQDFCPSPLRVVQLPCSSFPLTDKIALLDLPFDKQSQLSFRHVRLYADELLLLEAWNCFNPSLLAPALQEKLASSTVPFGALLGENAFTREALKSCQPSPVKPYMLAHEALLRRRSDQEILALVYEHYTAQAIELLHP